MEIIPNNTSTLFEVVKRMSKKEEVRDYDLERFKHWLESLDLKNKVDTYWDGLGEEEQRMYKMLVLFCDNNIPICPSSLKKVYALESQQIARHLLKLKRSFLLVKVKSDQKGCFERTYRLATRHKTFLTWKFAVEKKTLIEEVVSRYKCGYRDTKDQFYFAQIVRLQLAVDKTEQAVSLLTDVNFLKRRIQSGTVATLLDDFQATSCRLVGMSKRNCKKLHLAWALAEVIASIQMVRRQVRARAVHQPTAVQPLPAAGP